MQITFHDHDSFRIVSPVVHMFAMGRASPIYFGLRRGVSKNGKTKSRTRKEGEKIGTQGSMGKHLCLTYFWDLFNGNVRKEVLIFLILFE